jgi:hypothetical protein
MLVRHSIWSCKRSRRLSFLQMDFSFTDLFVEIFVGGLLFAFSVSPVLILISPHAMQRPGILPFVGPSEPNEAGSRPPPSTGAEVCGHCTWLLVVLIGTLYAIGISGNRVAERLFRGTHIDPTPTVSRVELVVRDHSDAARDFVERHKTYLKVSRAAFCSSVLFLLSMGWYRVVTRKRLPQAERLRYRRGHFVASGIVGVISLFSFTLENKHYWEQLRSLFEEARRRFNVLEP